jgi:hypothetical protein
MRLIDYVPEGLLKEPNALKFITVLSEAEFFKQLNIDKIHSAFNPLLQTNVGFMRKFFFEFGNLPILNGMPRSMLEGFILNAYRIFSLKGTKPGLKIFIRALGGDVIIDDSELFQGDEFIILDDTLTGYLPNEEDMKSTLPGYVPGAIDGDSLTFPKPFYLYNGEGQISKVDIAVISPFAYSEDFRNYLTETIPLFIPGISEESSVINIRYYSGAFLSNRRLKNFTYNI